MLRVSPQIRNQTAPSLKRVLISGLLIFQSTMEIKQLEDYLIQPFEEFISKLIKGSHEHSFFQTLRQILNGSVKEQDLARIVEQIPPDQKRLFTNIELQALFKQYDLAGQQDPKERESKQQIILKRIFQDCLKLEDYQGSQQPVQQAQNKNTLKTSSSKLHDKALSYQELLKAAGQYIYDVLLRSGSQLYKHLAIAQVQSLDGQYQTKILNQFGVECVDLPQSIALLLVCFRKGIAIHNLKQAFRYFSLSQMEQAAKAEPEIANDISFQSELLLKRAQMRNFDKDLNSLTFQERTAYREKLVSLYKWSIASKKLMALSQNLLETALWVGLLMNEIDFNLFVEYLACPPRLPAKEIFTTTSKQASRYCQQLSLEGFSFPKINAEALVTAYLFKYFSVNDKTTQFTPHLQTKFLNQNQALVMLTQGKEVPNIYSYLTEGQVRDLNQQTYVKICSYNNSMFSRADPVTLFVELKNVPKLTVKVYQFNPENHFLEKGATINPTISLDGLMPAEEKSYNYTQPPVAKFTMKFAFERIAKRNFGLFIIEFIGNGHMSRALIQKGRLLLQRKITPQGYALRIMNEHFEQCFGPHSGIWIEKQFYLAESSKEVLVPFVKRPESVQAIIVHERHAELQQLELEPANYQLVGTLFANTESFINGNQARLLLYLQLLLNETEVSLSLVESPEISVTTINEAGVPQKTPFKQQLTDKAPLELMVAANLKLKVVRVQVKGKVKNVCNQGESNFVEVSFTKQLVVESDVSTDCINSHYLRYDEENGYSIFLLGKTGEPKPGVEITLQFNIKNFYGEITKVLTTDAQGKVVIGQLRNVSYLIAQSPGASQLKVQIDYLAVGEQVSYPTSMHVLVNEEIQLPFVSEKLDPTEVALFSSSAHDESEFVIQSYAGNLTIKNKLLLFKLTEPGFYKLQIRSTNTVINIIACEGEKLADSSIKTQKEVIIDPENGGCLLVHGVVKTRKEEETLIKGRVMCRKVPKLVAIATNFISEDYLQILGDLKALQDDSITQVYDVSKYPAYYGDCTALPAESNYVLQRKSQERYVGNNLEQPSLLLKEQKYTWQDDFNDDNDTSQCDRDQCQQNQKPLYDMETRGLPTTGEVIRHIVGNFQFLKYGSLIIEKIQVKDAQFEFSVPNHFSSVLLFSFTKLRSICNLIGLANQPIPIRDITHKSTFKGDKFYSIFRSCSVLVPGQPTAIVDQGVTEFKVIDNLDKLFDLLKELVKMSKCMPYGYEPQNDWDFLPEWHRKDLPQKHQLYDKHQCNELNLFIMFKDPAYFQSYILPYVQNKVQKNVVDYFFLQDSSKLLDLTRVGNFEKLNALECALLVIYFTEISPNPPEAKQILAYMEAINKLNKDDQKYFKVLFDTALGLKFEGDEQANLPIQVQQTQLSQPQQLISQPLYVQQPYPVTQQVLVSQPVMQSYSRQDMAQPYYAAPQGLQQPTTVRNHAQKEKHFLDTLFGDGNSPRHQQQQGNTSYSQLSQSGYQQQMQPYYPRFQYVQIPEYQQAALPMTPFSGNNPGDWPIVQDQIYQPIVCQPVVAPGYYPEVQQVCQPVVQQVSQPQGSYGNYESQMDPNYQYQVHVTLRNKPTKNQKMDKKPIPFDSKASLAHGNKTVSSRSSIQVFKETDYAIHGQDNKKLIPISDFWVELAQNSLSKGCFNGFLPQKMLLSCQNLSQLLLIMAFVGLPFESLAPEWKIEEAKSIVITPKSPGLMFIKEVKEGQAQMNDQILVTQSFIDPEDRTYQSKDDPEIKIDKVIQECVISKIYCCQILVTNCSGANAEYQVLYEVPNGSLPINSLTYTKSTTVQLPPYSTQCIEYFFYFPKPGSFDVYPAAVSRFGQTMSVAKKQKLNVVEKHSTINTDLLSSVLATGTIEELLAFLSTKNIFDRDIFDSARILHMLQDRAAYLRIIAVLRQRKFYCFEIWQFSIQHNDRQSLQELLKCKELQGILEVRNAYYLQSSLIDYSYLKILAYRPLSQMRAHKILGKSFTNKQLERNYYSFLMYLVHKSAHSTSDQLNFIYYLLAQKRIDEAIKIFSKVKEPPKVGDCLLQYHYCAAYLDFYIGFPNFIKAREICEKYLDYPIIRWRNLFYEIANQLAEYDGDIDLKLQAEAESASQTQAAALIGQSESLSLSVSGNEMIITYSNLFKVSVSYFKIDLESYFSKAPFEEQASKNYFATVLPDSEISLLLSKDQVSNKMYKSAVQIPEALRTFNLLILVKGQGSHESVRYYPNTLKVQIAENLGYVRVCDDQSKHLSRVYIKVYVRLTNDVEQFYRDGYTDLRGRFDYAGIQDFDMKRVQKFALLIMSDNNGSLIRETQPPSAISQFLHEKNLVSKAWVSKAEKQQKLSLEKYLNTKRMLVAKKRL